jgi:hypothetical protein
VDDRTPQDYAIEHGRYLATAAVNYMTAVNGNSRSQQSEAWRALREAIHEFTKRADRASREGQK